MTRQANTVVAWALLGACVLGLVACSKSKETLAAEACIQTMVERVEPNRPYAADIAAIAASAKTESGDIMVIESSATLDKGQANESTQAFTCRIQFDPSKPEAPPSVVLFQFNF